MLSSLLGSAKILPQSSAQSALPLRSLPWPPQSSLPPTPHTQSIPLKRSLNPWSYKCMLAYLPPHPTSMSPSRTRDLLRHQSTAIPYPFQVLPSSFPPEQGKLLLIPQESAPPRCSVSWQMEGSLPCSLSVYELLYSVLSAL